MINMIKNPAVSILGTRVDCVEIPDVVNIVDRWIQDKIFHKYIVASNANNVVLGVKNGKIRDAANNSALSVPDGISLVMASRFYGFKLKKRVYGPDLMLALLELSEKKGYSSFFYGSTQKNLDLLAEKIRSKFPLLKIAGFYSPPFGPVSKQEDLRISELINTSCADIVWVGLGGPKQDVWMYEHSQSINAPVMIGIGAAFDFLSGAKPQAPRWIRDNGFEWLFRFIAEPGRLWRRYIINNSLFIYYITKELLLRALTKKGTKTGVN